MGDLQTDISQTSALAVNHGSLLHSKPLQKIAPVVQVNKENAAPNSAHRTASKLTSKGLTARVPETRSGLSAGHVNGHPSSTKKAFHGLSAGNASEDSHGRLHGGSATRTRESAVSAQKTPRMDASGFKDSATQHDTSESTKTEDLVISESKELYHQLSTREPFRDDLTKWCEYFKQYCERSAIGFDVLRVVLDRIQAERPECATMPGFVELWSLWASRLALEDQYDVFKMLKNACAKNRKVAALYISMASIKLKSGETSDALRELEKGIGYGAEPRSDLESMADSIRKSLGLGLSTRVSSTSGISQRTGLSSSNAALMAPSTPQHLVHMDCDSTPSTHLSSSIQHKPITSASKVRSLSTPSSIATRSSEVLSKPDAASTPSPVAQLDASGNPTSVLPASGSSSATTKRRSTTTLGARLGVRGGAQRIPKATAAASPATASNGMDVSRDESADRSGALAPIDESSALMQVDEPVAMLVSKPEQVSPAGGAQAAHVHFAPSPILASHVGMSAAAASLSSMYSNSTSSQTLGEYAVTAGGRSTEPLTGSSSTTQGFGTTSSSNSSTTNTSQPSSTSTSQTGLLSANHTEHSATAMRQLAQAIPSRMAISSTPHSTSTIQHQRGSHVASTNTNAMDLSEPAALPSSSSIASTAASVTAQSNSTQSASSYHMANSRTATASNVSSSQQRSSSPEMNGSNPMNQPPPQMTPQLSSTASSSATNTAMAVPPRTNSSERMVTSHAAPIETHRQAVVTPTIGGAPAGAFTNAPSSQPASQLPWLTQSTPQQQQQHQQPQQQQQQAAQIQQRPSTSAISSQAYPTSVSHMQSHQPVQQSIQPTYSMQAVPGGPVGGHMMSVGGGIPKHPLSVQQHQHQQPVDMTAAIESATAAAKALGRELFLVRGRPYVNLCAIGKGGTCSVYKVMDTNGGIWALKVITWTNDTIEVVKGYNEEVRLLELVQKSPYVVKLMDYEMLATSNTMYILFEFAETDLKRLFIPMKQDAMAAQIRPGGRFATDLDALRYYWRSMLSAVLVLHKSRIVHLDLKPANFVLVEGRVKIIDFGIAKKVLNDTMHAKVDDIAGTILYMAPETLKNTSGRGHPHKVGFPADVWSMGCILHQMVYGFTPFEHVSGLGPKIAAITASDPIEIQPIDNEDLTDCLRICLDKTASNRPTIEQLLNHPFLGGFIRWAQ